MAKQVKPVNKPFLRGSWRGKYATRKGLRLSISILFITVIYLLLGLMLSFDSPVLRLVTSLALVAFAAFYLYSQGANSGEADTAYGEIMYKHEQDGQKVVDVDRDRCYHPGKGFYEILIALIPYLLITFVFALLAQPLTYSLGVLPSWVNAASTQSHLGEALAYYNTHDADVAMSVLRIVSRAMTMPFINISLLMGTDAVLWAERLTPLWVSLAPLAFGFGYLQGPKLRVKVNTGIKIGVNNKKRKERKARKARAESKGPQQLI